MECYYEDIDFNTFPFTIHDSKFLEEARDRPTWKFSTISTLVNGYSLFSASFAYKDIEKIHKLFKKINPLIKIYYDSSHSKMYYITISTGSKEKPLTNYHIPLILFKDCNVCDPIYCLDEPDTSEIIYKEKA